MREVDGGKRRMLKEPYSPVLFARGEGSWRSIYGESLAPVNFSSPKATRDAIKHGIVTHGSDKWASSYINEQYPGRIEYDISHIVTAILDIEVSSDDGFPDPIVARHPVTAISIKTKDRMTTLGLKPHRPTESDVYYLMCRDERDMLERFLKIWEETAPDVLTGWNIDNFDVPYLINRIAQVLDGADPLIIGDKAGLYDNLKEKNVRRLSPWGKLGIITRDRSDGKHRNVYVIEGVASLDYMRLFENKNLVPRSYESYSLNAICVEELGESKIDYSEYESLAGLYERDHDTFVLYNQRDVRLIEKLEEKRGLIALVIAMAYRAKVNFQDVMASSRPWDSLIQAYLMDRGIAPPLSNGSRSTDRALLGGYVKPVQRGMYKWVVSFDVASEYPNTIIGCNISPDTIVGRVDELDLLNHMPYLSDPVYDERGKVRKSDDQYASEQRLLDQWHSFLLSGGLEKYRDMLIERDVCMTANGYLYSRKKQGFLPALLSDFFDERQQYKKLSLEAEMEITAIDAELARRAAINKTERKQEPFSDRLEEDRE